MHALRGLHAKSPTHPADVLYTGRDAGGVSPTAISLSRPSNSQLTTNKEDEIKRNATSHLLTVEPGRMSIKRSETCWALL